MAISCPAAGTCVAVGSYSDANPNTQGLIETLAGGSWTALEAPLPSNANASPDADLAGVSCPSVSSCVAVGSYTDQSSNEQAFADTLAGSDWTAAEVVAPGNATPNPGMQLNGVSCSSVGSCVSVGRYDSAGVDSLPGVIETLSGGTWTALAAPTVDSTTDQVDLTGVACPANGSCLAVGWYLDQDVADPPPLTETLAAGIWTPGGAVLPSDAATNPQLGQGANFNAVSCVQVGDCVAAGNYGDSSGNLQPLIEGLNFGAWTQEDQTLPANAGTGPSSAQLEGISCPADGICLAVGNYTDTSGNQQPLAETLLAGLAGGWTPSEPALPANAGGNPQANLEGSACTSLGACQVVGNYEDTSGHTQGDFDTSQAPGPITLYSDLSATPSPTPISITKGPDGALWFTNAGNNTIGRISTSGVVTTYSSPDIDVPISIVAGSDGALWFTNFTGTGPAADGSIGRITTAGVVTDYTSRSIDEPYVITSVPGGDLWFTNRDGGTDESGSIGRITTAGVVSDYNSPSITSPVGITLGSDGALWFTNSFGGTGGLGSIGRITKAGVITNYDPVGLSRPDFITSGPDGALWFTNQVNNVIGQITTAGVFTSFSAPSITSPGSITSGADGALWFTDQSGGPNGDPSIGRITTAGVVTNYGDLNDGGASGITAGPDGALWFAQDQDGSIGRLVLPVNVTTATVPTNVTLYHSYSATLAATGGLAPYTWSITAGSLPTGLMLSPAGVISGAPSASGTFNFTATATDDSYPGVAASMAYQILVNPPGPYTPLAPVRICDTRSGNPSSLSGPAAQCNGRTIAANGTLNINVAGSFGVPSTATSVVLNVTAVNTAAPGYLTVFPTGATAPLASNIDYVQGQVVPNLVQVGTGASGQVTIYSLAQSDVVVDVEGYVTPASLDGAGLYSPLASPVRICDTRKGNPSSLTGPNAQCNGTNSAGKTLSAGGSINVQVTGTNDIPAGATAAVFNVTDVNAAAPGYVSVYPEGGGVPNVSNLDYLTNQVAANRVIVPLSGSGQITLYSSASSDVVVDVSGYYSATSGSGSQFTVAAAPVRICDTRTTSPTNQCTGHTIRPNSSLNVQVTGLAGVPDNATAVVVNLTGVYPTLPTYLTVYPGPNVPFASDLDPPDGGVAANLVVATLNGSGQINIFNSAGSINVVVDVLGWYS